MRRFSILHVLLLIGSALALVSPVLLDQKNNIEFFYVLDSVCIAAGGLGGLLSSAFNFRRRKPWSQPWSRVDVFAGLVSVLYWTVTCGCVGGAIGLAGLAGVSLMATGAIATLICLPLLFLVPVAALAVPILAFASAPVLTLLLDVRNT